MDLVKVRNILGAVQRIETGWYILGRGGQEERLTTASAIAKTAHVTRATTYRYLPNLVRAGVLKMSATEHKGHLVYSYSITKDGKEFLNSWNELPF